MKTLNGTDIADFVKERQARRVRHLRQSLRVVPKLVIIQTNDDPVIDTYVRLKRRYAEDILIECELHMVTQAAIFGELDELNAEESVHGIIVQLPLANAAETDPVLQSINPTKDVDGLGSVEYFDPATPVAINWLLAAYNIELERRPLAIVGRGRLVGAPLERMWRNSGYDVTVFDEHSTDMSARLKNFPVVVTATGVPHLITSDMLQIGAVVVDAGTASEQGVIVGDVDEHVRTRTDLTITPLRGGVGPLTIAALFDNVITAAMRGNDAPDAKAGIVTPNQ